MEPLLVSLLIDRPTKLLYNTPLSNCPSLWAARGEDRPELCVTCSAC